MSRISDVSIRLGEYMLRGWILTDEGCTVCSIPMLRSPTGRSPVSLFCAQCQATPDAPRSASAGARPGVISREPPPPSTASTSSDVISRISTPPTEVSSTLSSPTFAPPPDPQETMRRQAQSDLASAEIGKRMLRGWAMLAEECPNNTCYGVPLVRPPKPGGKDPRKVKRLECVICHNVYIFGKDAYGLDRLVPLESGEPVPASQPLNNTASPTPIISGPTDAGPVTQETSQNIQDREVSGHSDKVENTTFQTSTVLSPSILIDPIKSLERSLGVLSGKLNALCSQTLVDHVIIGEVAMSMEKTTDALRALRRMYYQESSICA